MSRVYVVHSSDESDSDSDSEHSATAVYRPAQEPRRYPICNDGAGVPMEQFLPLDKAPVVRVDALDAAGGSSLATHQPDSVTYRYNIDVPLAELQTQADGGHALTLRVGAGIDEQVEFSNKAHASSDLQSHGAVDFVTGVDVKVDRHTITSPIIVSGPVRAMKGEAVLDKRTMDKNTPFGCIGIKVPMGSGAGTFRRTVTQGQYNFITTYPGQTADNLDKGVKFFQNEALLSVDKPQSAVVHFYNTLMPDERASERLSADSSKLDAKGRAYGDRAIAETALKQAQESIPARIAYSNVTDVEQFTLRISLPPTNILKNAKTVEVQQPLLYAFRKGASYGAAIRENSGSAELAEARILANPESVYHLSGTYTVYYHKVTPNFRLAPVTE